MTSRIYYGKPGSLDGPLNGLEDASAVLDFVTTALSHCDDLHQFDRNEGNHSIEGLEIVIDSARHAIDKAAAELWEERKAAREEEQKKALEEAGARAAPAGPRPLSELIDGAKPLSELLANTPPLEPGTPEYERVAARAAGAEQPPAPAEPKLTETHQEGDNSRTGEAGTEEKQAAPDKPAKPAARKRTNGK